MKHPILETRKFDVVIPNLEENGIAEVVSIDVQVFIDPQTAEEILTPESLDLIEKTKARRMGLLTTEEIKRLRTRLNLTQGKFSELLQIGAKTWTRWEAGRLRPSRSMNVLLCTLRDGVVSLDYLEQLRNLRERRDWATFFMRRRGNSILLFPKEQGFWQPPHEARGSHGVSPWVRHFARQKGAKQANKSHDSSSVSAWQGNQAA